MGILSWQELPSKLPNVSTLEEACSGEGCPCNPWELLSVRQLAVSEQQCENEAQDAKLSCLFAKANVLLLGTHAQSL